MNKRNFVTGYMPDKSDFDDLQIDLELGINQTAAAVAGMGIQDGFQVTLSGTQALVSAGKGFDGFGNPVMGKAEMALELGDVDRPAPGRFKWLSLFVRYKVREEGQVIDIYNTRHPFLFKDDCSLETSESEEGTVSQITLPDPEPWQIPLADIRLDSSTDWENLPVDCSRRPVLTPVAVASTALAAHQADSGNPHGVGKDQVGLGAVPNWNAGGASLGSEVESFANEGAVRSYVDSQIISHDSQHDDRFVRPAGSGFASNELAVFNGTSGHSIATSNKSISSGGTMGYSSAVVPTENRIKSYVDSQIAGHDTQHDDRFVQPSGSGFATNELAVFNGTSGRHLKTSNKSISSSGSMGQSSSIVPTENRIKSYVDAAINAAKNAVWPVGAFYTQYPGGSTPSALGLPGTWTAQFETEGIFFRTPDGYYGNALNYDGGIQSDAIRNITGSYRGHGLINNDRSRNPTTSGAFSQGVIVSGFPPLLTTGGVHSAIAFDASDAVPTASENRPKNRTFRVWKRTA